MTTLAEIQRHIGVTADGILGPATLTALAKALGMDEHHIRTISNAGLQIIKNSEGLRLKAYRCPAGIPTVGYGHTAGVRMGDVITEAQADAFLRDDVKDSEEAVRKLCPTTTQGQFDALVSFTFNLGEGQLKESTLRRLHNEGNYSAAADQFARWRFADGVELAGLVKRRAAEKRLYLS